MNPAMGIPLALLVATLGCSRPDPCAGVDVSGTAFPEVRGRKYLGAIIPADHADNSPLIHSWGEFWTPVASDIEQLEASLASGLLHADAHPSIVKNLADYRRQYVGIVQARGIEQTKKAGGTMLNVSRIGIATIVGLTLGLAAGCGGGGDATDNAPATTPPGGSQGSSSASGAEGPAGPTGSGRIAGKITFEGQAPTLRAIKMDADPGCAAKHSDPVRSESLVLGEANALANVFVAVKNPPPGRYAPPSEPLVMDQNGCRYRPHVMGIVVGQEFKILNSDGLLHNVHSMSKINKQFNMAMPANRTEATERFAGEEFMFLIKCDVHPWMNAYMAVMPHPFFSVTGTDGTYSIEGLPAGTYEIEAWHEKMGTRPGSITLTDGETGSVDFSFERAG